MKRLSAAQIPILKKKLLAEQQYRCALCDNDLSEVPTKDICLDHDHKAGHVRAVLCRNCNGIEGKIYNLANRGKRGRTVREYLARVLAYWDKHAEPAPAAIYHPKHKTADEKRVDRNKKARLARARKKALENIGKR